MAKNLFILAAFLALALPVAQAAEKMDKAAQPKTTDKAAMTQDPKAMMAEMQKLAAPNEHHQVLNVMAGQWEHTGRMWMSASDKPQEFRGSNVNQWILGNRFMQQRANGTMMGHPFEGIGIVGYDNMKGEYSTLWMDNMSTSMMTGSSHYDPATKTFSESGSFACPMTGEKNKPYRAAFKLMGNDRFSYEMFMKGEDGKEFRTMEIQYQRAK